MMRAFRRKLALATLGLGACRVYDSSMLIGFADAPSAGSGSAPGGRDNSGSGAPSGASGTLGGSGGISAASGATNKGGTGGAGGRSGSSGSDAASGEGGASGDGGGGEAGMESAGGESGAQNAGAGGSGGGVIAGETCTGCARLSVPLTSSPSDRSHFVIALPGGPDFTGATVNYRVFFHAGTTGQFIGYLQDTSGFTFQAIGSVPLSSISGWQDLSWVVTSTAAGFDVTDIQLLGIEILGETGALNPTVLYVDSISVESLGLQFGFDDASTVMEGPQTEHLSDQKMWLNSDSKAGSSLSWLGE